MSPHGKSTTTKAPRQEHHGTAHCTAAAWKAAHEVHRMAWAPLLQSYAGGQTCLEYEAAILASNDKASM